MPLPADPYETAAPDLTSADGSARASARPDRRAPLRVLHVVQPVEGGVARVVVDLVRAQRESGLDVHLACPDGGTLSAEARRWGAVTHTWQAGRSPGPALPRESAALRRLLGDVGPDLVHAHSAKAGLAARLVLRGSLPTVFQPHAWSFEAVEGVVAALSRRWERHGARWADRVLCVSEAERLTGLRAGVRAAWSVLPNGVDLRVFRPEGARFAYADGAPLVVCVGRLCRQKGQDVLLRAWPRVRRQVPGARLVLVGAGPEEQALRAAAPEGVEFVGATPDAAPWYRAADLVVLPSRWEGMALAPLEAMACGRAVVLSEVGGARESLPSRSAPHCLVPPGEPAALAATVARLLADRPLRAQVAGRALAHVRAVHDVQRTAHAVTGLYRDLRPAGAGPAPGRAGPPAPRATTAVSEVRETRDVRGAHEVHEARDVRGARVVHEAREPHEPRATLEDREPMTS